MSDREAEILKQQRLVAARLTASNNNNANKKPAAKNTQKRPTLKQPSTASLKRPTLKSKPPPPSPMTAAKALAAAKSRVATSAAISKEQTNHTTTDGKPSVKKKTLQLAQLVSASMQTSSSDSNDHHALSTFQTVMEPGDFWKHFRDWNILQQFVGSNTTATSSSKPLPDTFVSHGHYISAWAPLCLAEARAQVMSDYQATPAYKKTPLLPVSVKPVTKDGSTMLDSLQLQVHRQRKPKQQQQHREQQHREQQHREQQQQPQQQPDLSFMPNDLVVLVPNNSKEFVESLLNGSAAMDNTIDTSSLRKHAMVGHAEYRRDTVDGLLVRVGKQWWATLGHQSDMMWLLKLGFNVMVVQEFTALCRVEQLSLKRFILGQHLVDETHSKRHFLGQNTEKMLANMGGTNAFGKGFIHHVECKLNPLQLAAILVAAEEYGDGWRLYALQRTSGKWQNVHSCGDTQ